MRTRLLASLMSLALGACGGGGDSSSPSTGPTPPDTTPTVDLIPPSARIAFPTPMSYTNASTITVRGNANDAHGVSSVRVNGVAATSTDGFQTWKATVPVVFGQNSIAVSVTDTAGNVATSAATASVINRGPPSYGLQGLDYDPAGDRIVATDDILNVVYEYRASDGIARVLSPAPGATDGQYAPGDIAVDAARNRAIMIETNLDALIAVDLATGARSVVASGPGASSNETFYDGSIIALDTANDRAFVSNPTEAGIIAVDLVTGARTVVTGVHVGSGLGFSSPTGLAYDDVSTPGTPRLLVSQGSTHNGPNPGEIVAVNIATGERTASFPFPLFPVPKGPAIDTPGPLRIDAANHRLLMFDNVLNSIFAIDLATGDRTILVGEVGGGVIEAADIHLLALNPVTSRLFAVTSVDEILGISLASGVRSRFAYARAGSGLPLNYPEGLAIEQASGTPASLLLTDRGLTSLMRVNLASGERTAVSDAAGGIGNGPALRGGGDVVLDTRTSSNGHSALVLLDAPSFQLMSVDLVSGDRTVLADLNVSAPAVKHPSNLRLDASRNRVLFTDLDFSGVSNAIYAVDLATGARTTISDASRGQGAPVPYASSITLDPATNPTRALVSDIGVGGIFAVDLATGNRSVLADPYPGVGFQGDNVPTGVFADTRNSRLLALRVGAVNNLFSMPIAGGAQQVLSGDNPSTSALIAAGPRLVGCFALDVSMTDSVAFAACPWTAMVMAIDLVSGDRVMIAR